MLDFTKFKKVETKEAVHSPRTEDPLKSEVDFTKFKKVAGDSEKTLKRRSLLSDAMTGVESNSINDLFDPSVFPTNYKVSENTVADVIAKGEEASKAINKANTNLFNSKNDDGTDKFTAEEKEFKGVNDARAVYNRFKDRGYKIPSSAAGTYQFITPSIKQAMKGSGIKGTDILNKDTQDKLAMSLLMGNQTISSFLNGEGATVEQAYENLGGIWEGYSYDIHSKAKADKLKARAIKMLKGIKSNME